jgi:predicted GNAT superfamily acetyltransferase
VPDGKVARRRNKTIAVRRIVQGVHKAHHAAKRNGHGRVQDDLRKPAPFSRFFHKSFGVVHVLDDGNPGLGAFVEEL